MNQRFKTFAFIAAMALSLFAATAWAQQAGKGGNGQPALGNGQGSGQLRLFQELNLDEAQAAEVQAIMEAARLMQAEEWALFQANMEAIRTETHNAIMAVLDEAQQARFLELQELRSEQWADGNRGRGGMGGQGGQRGPGAGDGAGECTNPDGPNPDCPYTGTSDDG